jgi:Cys/Met metabolism PLP-dependent enzyme
VQPGRTALVMVESPTNPRMQVCDIAALAAIAHEAGAVCCVDNRCAAAPHPNCFVSCCSNQTCSLALPVTKSYQRQLAVHCWHPACHGAHAHHIVACWH